MNLSPARSAGLLLLLTAVATAVAVATRLSGSAEPASDAAVPLPIIVDTGQYAVAAVARLVSGLALVAAAVLLRPALRGQQPALVGLATILLALSGAATAISGATMLALAVALPAAGDGAVILTAGAVPGWIYSADAVRWILGKAGFFLAGLGLIALGPVQWRIGGLLKVSAVADVIIGVAMLFIWIDAATVMHRVSGIAFLAWLIVSGVWLTLGLLRPGPSAGEPAPRPAPGGRGNAA